MKCAIYARVSTREQTTSHQTKLLKDWVARRGWIVHRVYEDIESGTKASRPSWDELLADMRQYRFKAVVVTKLDRIGRSLQHLLSILEEFKGKGVEFIAATQNIDTTTAAGKLQMQIMGAFAEFERNIISERTREALKGNKKVGKRGKDKKPRRKRGVLRKPLSL
jgi:DNA invertase Pin-like site-specific DNA recombinase